MTGAEILKRDMAEYGEYASFLLTLALHFDEKELYDLVEQAEALGKRLGFDDSKIDSSQMDGDIIPENIIFV